MKIASRTPPARAADEVISSGLNQAKAGLIAPLGSEL